MAKFGLNDEHLDDRFCRKICFVWARRNGNRDCCEEKIEILSKKRIPLAASEGLLSNLEENLNFRITGHQLFQVKWTLNGKTHSSCFHLKVKVRGTEMRQRLMETYRRKIDSSIADTWSDVSPHILDNTHAREINIYKSFGPTLETVGPQIYATWIDEDLGIYLIVMETLEGMRHLSTIDTLDSWTDSDIRTVLGDAAKFHGFFTDNRDLRDKAWFEPYSVLNNHRLFSLQSKFLLYCGTKFPHLFTQSRTHRLHMFQQQAEDRNTVISKLTTTLIHGDFTPRNVCLRTEDGMPPSLCAYDWELAQENLPQRDIWEFLIYAANPRKMSDKAWISEMWSHYQMSLLGCTGRGNYHASDFEAGITLSLVQLATSKLLLQGATHQLIGRHGYFDRIVNNTFHALDLFAQSA